MKKNVKYFCLSIGLLILLFPTITSAQDGLHSFTLQQVELLSGDFKDAQQTDLKYILALDPDRLLAPFLKEAALKPKKEKFCTYELLKG